MKTSIAAIGLAFLLPVTAAFAGAGPAGHHHGNEYSAGRPGDPKKPARTVAVSMREEYGRQIFVPDKISVKKGEQVRFVIKNDGTRDHEFLLATTAENLKHAAAMRKNPDMEHDEPNGIRLAPGKSGEIVWKFTKRGAFEFSCLIPGHREDGMIGTIILQ